MFTLLFFFLLNKYICKHYELRKLVSSSRRKGRQEKEKSEAAVSFFWTNNVVLYVCVCECKQRLGEKPKRKRGRENKRKKQRIEQRYEITLDYGVLISYLYVRLCFFLCFALSLSSLSFYRSERVINMRFKPMIKD